MGLASQCARTVLLNRRRGLIQSVALLGAAAAAVVFYENFMSVLRFFSARAWWSSVGRQEQVYDQPCSHFITRVLFLSIFYYLQETTMHQPYVIYQVGWKSVRDFRWSCRFLYVLIPYQWGKETLPRGVVDLIGISFKHVHHSSYGHTNTHEYGIFLPFLCLLVRAFQLRHLLFAKLISQNAFDEIAVYREKWLWGYRFLQVLMLNREHNNFTLKNRLMIMRFGDKVFYMTILTSFCTDAEI